jgi:hypothetical protein
MEITYSSGPRYIDGVNIDTDVSADHPRVTVVQVSDPVTGLVGPGYEPGQKNRDGTEL